MRGSPSGAASASRTAPSRSASGGSAAAGSLDSRRVPAGSVAVSVPAPYGSSAFTAGSRRPLARAVVGEAALLARMEIVHGGRHGHREPQRQLGADVPDVMDGAARHPHDVVLVRAHDRSSRQL